MAEYKVFGYDIHWNVALKTKAGKWERFSPLFRTKHQAEMYIKHLRALENRIKHGKGVWIGFRSKAKNRKRRIY